MVTRAAGPGRPGAIIMMSAAEQSIAAFAADGPLTHNPLSHTGSFGSRSDRAGPSSLAGTILPTRRERCPWSPGGPQGRDMCQRDRT